MGTPRKVLPLVAALFAPALLLFAWTPVAASPFDAPPGRLLPPAISLDEVLARNERASGPEPSASSERWDLSAYGLRGTEHDVYAGDDFRETTELGPFSFGRGRRNGRAWRQNANGITLLLSAARDRDAISAAALRDLRAHRGAVRLLGETATGQPAYVVQVAPPGGRREWIYYDKASALVTRVEFAFPDRRVTIVAGDFRATGNVVRAWHLHASDTLGPENDVDWRLADFDPAYDAGDDDLAIPPTARPFDEFPEGVQRVRLPARFLDAHVIVQVDVGGRPLDFLLDSGTSDIVIDRNVARGLGLTAYGHSKNATAGAYVQSQVLIPQAHIGKIALHDVAAYALPFSYSPGSGVHVVGLIGFDFFAGAVIHVDYLHRTVEAIAQDAFRAAAFPAAARVDVNLDDGVPVARALVGGAAGRFIIDTGSVDVVVFSRFAREHPREVADAGGGADLRDGSGYFSAGSVGGHIKLVPTQLRSFAFAGNVFRDFIVERVHDAPSFEVEDADGLIGYEFLRYFDVFFDYAQSRIYFVPNQWLRQAAGA